MRSNESKHKNLILFALSLLVFSGVFSLKYLASLDSVYYFKEAFSDLTSTINLWGSYDAPFGGPHLILWLYPVTYFAGQLGNLLNIDWNILVRLFFYLPSIFLSIYSIQKLAKLFNLGEKGQFLMSLIYVFNTYFILLVDGGQLGVMLAYSILPLAVESIINFKFIKTLTFLSLIAIFDPRFLILSLILGILLSKFEISKIFKISLTLLFVTLLNSYWIIPLIKLGGIEVPTFVSNLKLVTLKNSLLLHQPHWPLNEFGKTTDPSYLFLIFPIFLLLSNIFRPTRNKVYLSILFLFFAFLVKGESWPYGELYTYVINNFPFVSVFRDSTKFFPLLIISFSLIISKYYDGLKNKLFIYLIPVFLISPLVPGLITGVTNNAKGLSDVNSVLGLKEITYNPTGFSRTVYIPVKPQLAFQTEQNQAIDGRVLADYLPFAADNYGSEDRFNFMLRSHYINYFRSLGIKDLVYFIKGEILTAKIDDPMPEKYFIDKLVVVVGSPIGVENLVPEYGVLFLEEGKTNLKHLLNKNQERLFFVLNQKSMEDLVNSIFIEKFIDFSTIPNNNWAKYQSSEYLTWKYQLLIREVDTKEINFNKGISFSTIKDEEIKYIFNSESSGKHRFYIRSLGGKDSKGITVNNKIVRFDIGGYFSWKFVELDLIKGPNEVIIKNSGGLNVLSTGFMIPENEYLEGVKDIENKLKNFSIYNQISKLPISIISFTPKNGWMIWNTSFDDRWNLDGQNPISINSITNGFEVGEQTKESTPIFTPNRYVQLGVKLSLVSVFVLIMSYFSYAINTHVQERKKSR